MSDGLADDQEVLGKAIERARAGEDRALAQQVREGGEQIVRILTGLLRLMRTHTADNHAFDNPTRDLSAALVRLIDILGPLHIVCVEGQVYLNDIRIRMDERIGGAADLADELKRHGSGGMGIAEALDEAAIRRMIQVLSAPAAPDRPLSTLQTGLREKNVAGVTVQGQYRLRLTGESAPATHAPDEKEILETLDRAAGLVSEAWDNLSEARVPNPLPVRRLVNDIIDTTDYADQILDAEQSGPSVNAAAHARHSLRVCTIAVMIGKALGLPPAALADLGVAAMFHDTGYASKEDGFSPPFERHGTAGARLLLKQRGFHQAKLKRILVALEHHRGVGDGATLYSRIVHVADDFDTLTRHRSGGPLHGPAHALALMDGASGTLYDPVILQAFVNRIGRYPPGSLLRLRDGRWAVSISGARTRQTFDKPLCRVIRSAKGELLPTPFELDLAVEGEIARVVPVRG